MEKSPAFFMPEGDIAVNLKISLPKIELTKMSENNTSVEKVDLMLMEMANWRKKGKDSGCV